MAEQTVTGSCRRGLHDSCDGVNRTATGWNWWCTCSHHPEPKITDPAHQPALDLWRRHRAGIAA